MNPPQLRSDLPEPVRRYLVEVAEMEPPADLLDAAVAEIERTPRANGDAALPILGFVAAAAVVIALVASSLLSPGGPNVGTDGSRDPTAAAEPTGSASPAPDLVIGPVDSDPDAPIAQEVAVSGAGEGRLVRSDATVRFAYSVPPGVAFTAWWMNGTPAGSVAFTMGGPGPYGADCTQFSCTFIEGARGVVVADITGVTTAHEDDEDLRDDPEGFLLDLDPKRGFHAKDVAEGRLGALPAWTARVTPDEGYPYLDTPDGAHPATVSYPSYFLAAALDERLLLVQIWAETEEELDAWLPTAMDFVDSLEFMAE